MRVLSETHQEFSQRQKTIVFPFLLFPFCPPDLSWSALKFLDSRNAHLSALLIIRSIIRLQNRAACSHPHLESLSRIGECPLNGFSFLLGTLYNLALSPIVYFLVQFFSHFLFMGLVPLIRLNIAELSP